MKHGVETVGTAIRRLPVDGCRDIFLKAPGADDEGPNSDRVWIGGPDLTEATGFELTPGVMFEFHTQGFDELYVLGGAAGQKVQWIAV